MIVAIAIAVVFVFIVASADALKRDMDPKTPAEWGAPEVATHTPSATATEGWWDNLPTKIEVPTAKPASSVKTAGKGAAQASPTPELHMESSMDINLTPTFDLP
ncbi:MAG: hypothetical protein WBM17_17585 [Anaerolineales bacterium]